MLGILETFLNFIKSQSALSLILFAVPILVFLEWLLKEWLYEIRHRHEIEKEQLKKLTIYSKKYYIRYISLIETIKEKIDKKDASEISFYSFALWLFHRDKWIKEANNYLVLKNHTAEKLLVRLFSKQFKYLQENGFNLTNYHHLVEIMNSRFEIKNYFNEFQKQLTIQPLCQIYQNFQNWMVNIDKKTKKNFCNELEIYSKIFDSEIFHCLRPWYKHISLPVFDSTKYQTIKKELIALYEEKWIQKKEINLYLKRLRTIF